jgi:hypothetical protein
MVALFHYLANSLLPPSRPQTHSSASCGLLSPACRTALAAHRQRRRNPRRCAPPLLFTCGRPPVAGTGASLSRSLPRQGPRRQILHGGCRWLSNGGLGGLPQATSREGPAVTGSDPSSRPAFPVAWQLILHRLSPVRDWGGVVWRPSTRLRVLEKSAST